MNFIKWFFILNVLVFNLYADVKINAPTSFLKGEAYVFSIEINGSDITFPDLNNVLGFSVQELSSSTSTNIINSTISKSVKKIYSIYPDKSFVFPALTFNIDGESLVSKEKEILEKKINKTNSDIFDLSIKSDKNDLYVGESFIVTLKFKFRKDAKVVGLNLQNPNFENFWSKQLGENKQYEENSFVVQEINFLVFPLKEGIQKISPVKIQVQVRDPAGSSYSFFSNQIKTLKIYSNELNLNIKKLPDGINLIGDFEIKASVNKTDVKNSEAVSYKLEISGSGNIDDIKDIKLEIPGTTIYENKPNIEGRYKNGKYEGKYEKTYSILSNKSFKIPSIEIKYFDKTQNKVITKKSKNINITVENTKTNKTASILEKKEGTPSSTKEVIKIVEKTSVLNNIVYFCIGVFVTLLILGLYLYVINYKRKEKLDDISLVKQVKKTKTGNELLKVLAVYIKINPHLDEMIFKLEKTENFDLLKKEIIQFLKKTKIQG